MWTNYIWYSIGDIVKCPMLLGVLERPIVAETQEVLKLVEREKNNNKTEQHNAMP